MSLKAFCSLVVVVREHSLMTSCKRTILKPPPLVSHPVPNRTTALKYDVTEKS